MTDSLTTELAEVDSPPRAHGATAAHIALVVLLLATAVVRFWRSPTDAGGRLTTPDGAEYAVAAHRLATLGTLDIDVGGTRFPSRYPPLFSAVLLAPVYAVAPGEIGNGIIVVLAFALLMVSGAYGVGWHIAGPWGALAATSAVIHHRLLADLARTIMSDLPAAALAVAGLALFLRMQRSPTLWMWLAAGVMVAVAAGLRPLAATLLLPFFVLLLRDRRRFMSRLAALLTPLLLLGVLTGIYNHQHFGLWSRTGYHYWCPIPYEFPTLTWSLLYVEDNVRLLALPWLGLTFLAGAAGLAILFVRKHPAAGRVAGFIALAALPLSVAHLYYFHREPRFHAMFVALCCVSAGAGAALLLPQRVPARPWGAVALAVLGLLLARPPRDVHESSRPAVAYLAKYVPPGGTIVTGMDPVPLDPVLLRPGARHWVPVTRRQNYAGHPVAPRPIDLPADAVLWPGSHRQPALMAAGVVHSVPWTATERPDLLARRMVNGPGVFYDIESVPIGSEPYKRMNRLFVMRPVDPQGRVQQLLSLRRSDEGDQPEAK